MTYQYQANAVAKKGLIPHDERIEAQSRRWTGGRRSGRLAEGCTMLGGTSFHIARLMSGWRSDPICIISASTSLRAGRHDAGMNTAEKPADAG